MDTLRQAAQTVVERWAGTRWRDQPSMALDMSDLRKALEAPEAITAERDALLLANLDLKNWFDALKADYDALMAEQLDDHELTSELQDLNRRYALAIQQLEITQTNLSKGMSKSIQRLMAKSIAEVIQDLSMIEAQIKTE